LRLGRVDAGRGQGLPLREGPGGEQGLRGGSQPVAGEVGEPYPFLPGEPVTWPQAHQQRLGAEHLAGQAVAFIDEPAGDADVDGRVRDRLDEVGQPELRPAELDSGRGLGERRCQLPGQHRRDRRGHAHADGAAAAVGEAVDGGGRRGDLLEDFRRMSEQFRAGLGERDAAGGPDQQRRAELPLQAPDQVAEGGLPDVQLLGRAPEVQLGSNSHECFQLAKLHHPKLPSAAGINRAGAGLIAPAD
jgi:hypothetical protein